MEHSLELTRISLGESLQTIVRIVDRRAIKTDQIHCE
jgi:hypothetical protein